MKNTLFLLTLLFLFACNNEPQTEHQLLLKNATAYMPDGTTKSVDILVDDDKITKIEAGIKAKAAKTIDAEGKFVMPGLIDAHAHFTGIGNSKATLNLLGVDTWAEVVASVKKEVEKAEPGEWIVGRGWHQDKWKDKPSRTVNGNPAHDDLSAISPDNPVLLNHASGHGILVNAKAMELAGVNANTKAPSGGFIVRDENNEPIGVFQENASSLIYSVYGVGQEERTEEERQKDWYKLVDLAEEECLQYGITTLHDAGISFNEAQKFNALAEKGDLDVRLFALLSDYEALRINQEQFDELKSYDNPYFTCKAIKAYMDGALGSRGAWLLEDYHDKPGYRGENVTPIEKLKQTAEVAAKQGFQVGIHAIGDRGNREVIDVYEQALGDKIGASRWRIEHAQHLHPDDIARIGELGIIASMQTIHCTSDSPFVEQRLGEKRAEEGAYVWQSLLQNGVHIANGTDSPIERVDPFANLYAAVTRKRVGEDKAFYPAQILTRQQALDSYTKWNAYSAFQEDEKGEIAVGKLADLVILDTNLLTCEPEDILDTKVLYTIIGGEVKYKK